MRWSFRIFLISALSIASVLLAHSQHVGFDNITIDDGLMHNNVNSIVQDDQGFIWFGTRDGFCRYDGYDFRMYPLVDSAGNPLGDQRIERLFDDAPAYIWVMPTSGGLHFFNTERQKFEQRKIIQSLPWLKSAVIESVMRDRKGNYWIGTTENGVVRLDSTLAVAETFTTLTAEPNRQITGEHCYSIAEDNEGRIWFGLSGLYVNRYDPMTDTLAILGQQGSNIDESYSYRRALAHSGDTMWIGTEGKGIMTYDISAEAIVDTVLPGVFVRDMEITPEGQLLIATDGSGLYSSIEGRREFRRYTFDPNHVKSLSTNALYDLFIDRDSNIWIGTYNGGVNLLARQQARFSTFSLPSISEAVTGSNSVISFAGENSQSIWTGLDGGGIWQLSIPDERLTPLSSIYPGIEISSDVITSLYLDDANILWAGTFLNGLNKIDLSNGSVEVFRSEDFGNAGLQNNNIWDIVEDADGRIWIATLGGGLHVLNPETNEFRQYLPEAFGSSLSDRNVRVLYLDRKQNLWIGTERGGLNKLLPDRKTFISWKHKTGENEGLQSDFILAITEDSRGNIWIGTEGGGLHRLLPDETGFEHYGNEDGLPSNIIYSIEEDRNGRLWMGTSKGLVYLAPGMDQVIRFDQRDGLLSNQFNPNASLSTSNGPLVFGSIKGISAVSPERINIDGSFPEVLFTDLKVFDESVPVGDFHGRVILSKSLNSVSEVKLKHFDNAFTISFAALAFNAPQKVQYAYRLRGFNDNWVYVDADNRNATYTNLDAGDYTFEVKASNVFGEWPESYKELDITVQPPFWNTLWFKSLMALIIVAIVFLLLRYIDIRRREEQTRKLEHAQQEILRLQNERLEREILSKNSELSAALLQSAHKNKALASLGEQLKEISNHDDKRVEKEKDLRRLVRKISTEVDSVNYWEQFQLNFDAVHQDFSHKLFKRHPNLTQNDIRLCSLIRVNMTNTEIGSIQNISKSGVEKSKYRLKQKLGLSAEDDLHTYIQALK